jgi:hypothetical protein
MLVNERNSLTDGQSRTLEWKGEIILWIGETSCAERYTSYCTRAHIESSNRCIPNNYNNNNNNNNYYYYYYGSRLPCLALAAFSVSYFYTESVGFL